MATPVPLPHRIVVTVGKFDIQEHARALMTTNSKPIHGHDTGAVVLTTFIARPDHVKRTWEVTYEWSRATSFGGVPPEKLYSTYDHTTLPGVKEEGTSNGQG